LASQAEAGLPGVKSPFELRWSLDVAPSCGSAKSSNPRPKDPCVTIWFWKRTRVRFRFPPPYWPKKGSK